MPAVLCDVRIDSEALRVQEAPATLDGPFIDARTIAPRPALVAAVSFNLPALYMHQSKIDVNGGNLPARHTGTCLLST